MDEAEVHVSVRKNATVALIYTVGMERLSSGLLESDTSSGVCLMKFNTSLC